jgi:hypothetical protein
MAPPEVVEELRLAGGNNRFGEPNFRVVWGYDRIVPMHGRWENWQTYLGTLTDKYTGHKETRQFVKLESSVIETRLVPKYLPGNCWHLEMWRPPEEYGTREEWAKLGEEVIDGLTIDTSGPYPDRGEYELCYPLTHDGTSNGTPIPLVTDVVAELVRHIVFDRGKHSFLQRKAAIEQRLRREEEGYVKLAMERMTEGMRPFAGEKFVTVPAGTGDNNEPS